MRYMIAPVYSMEEIRRATSSLGRRLWMMYGQAAPVIVVVAEGGIPFSEMLMDQMRRHGWDKPDVLTVKARSYQGTKRGPLSLTWRDKPTNIWSRDVLIVEDIIDSGTTVKTIEDALRMMGANDVQVASVLQRYSTPTSARYHSLFNIDDDAFMVGFGLDHDGKFRELEGVYEYTPEESLDKAKPV